MKQFLEKNLTTKDTKELLELAVLGVKGWINYHGISDNKRRVKQFIQLSRRLIYRWFNRRGGKKKMNWETCDKILKAVDFPKHWKTVSMY